MGILGELNQMAKAKRVDQLHMLLSDEIFSGSTGCDDIAAYIGINNPRIAGVYRRQMHHNTEISIASYR